MFGSNAYRQTFYVRFFGYFSILIGLMTVVLGVEPVLGEELKYRSDRVLRIKHTLPQIVTSSQGPVESSNQQGSADHLGGIISGVTDTITPVSTDFGLVVEKINANARVIANVDPSNELEYIKALSQGIAHAKGTAYPGQVGNIYLFSHSTDAPWNIVRYNAIFYLLGKLEPGDRVIVFFKGRRYDYIVFDKAIASGADTNYITNKYDKSILTLQTCDPPGTTLNRLLIRAKLVAS